MSQYLSDDEVFGGGYLSDAEVLGLDSTAGAGRGSVNPPAVVPRAEPTYGRSAADPRRLDNEAPPDLPDLPLAPQSSTPVNAEPTFTASRNRSGSVLEDEPEQVFDRGAALRDSLRVRANPQPIAARGPVRELKPSAPIEERSLPRAAGDTALGLYSGAMGLAKGVADNVNAGANPVSDFIETAQSGARRLMSPDLRDQQIKRESRILTAQRSQGELAGARAAWQSLFDLPAAGLDTMAQGAGSLLPSLMLGMSGAPLSVISTVNAASVAGEGAERTAKKLRELSPTVWADDAAYQQLTTEAGASHAEAVAILAPIRAVPAQVAGAVAGAISGRVGVEGLFAGQAANTVRARAGRAAGELGTEQLETVLPGSVANTQIGAVDGRTSWFEGLGKDVVDTAVGTVPGAALAATGSSPKQPKDQAARALADLLNGAGFAPLPDTLGATVNPNLTAAAPIAPRVQDMPTTPVVPNITRAPRAEPAPAAASTGAADRVANILGVTDAPAAVPNTPQGPAAAGLPAGPAADGGVGNPDASPSVPAGDRPGAVGPAVAAGQPGSAPAGDPAPLASGPAAVTPVQAATPGAADQVAPARAELAPAAINRGAVSPPSAAEAAAGIPASPPIVPEAKQPATKGDVAEAVESAVQAIIGRDSIPIDEGGKPFKTRAAAAEAKKLQPALRVVTVDGGFALAPKTDKQLAAEEAAAKRLRQPSTSPKGEPIPAHAFIAAEGGLSQKEMADAGFDVNPKVGNRSLFAAKGKGLTIEQATQALIQDGYLPEGASHTQAYDLIRKSLTTPQYNPDGWERVAQAEAEARRMEAADAANERMVDAAEEVQALTDEELAWADQNDDNIPDIFAEGETLTDEDADRIFGAINDGQQADTEAGVREGDEVAGEAEAGAAAPSAGPRDRAPRGEQDTDEGLTRPTEDDILAQQERAEQGQRARTQADREAERRNRADRERDEFTLTGSDRAADANADQEVMFSRERTIEVDGVRRPIEDSKGRLVGRDFNEQQAFWRWAGDTAVVDGFGRPIVMYHGTSKNQDGDAFTMFDTYASNYGLMGQGSYFTAEPMIASEYTRKGRGDTPTVYSVYLSIKNPIDMDAKADADAWRERFPDADSFHEGGDTNESWYRAAEEAMRDAEVPAYEGAEALQEGLRAMGYDGIKHVGGGRVKDSMIRHRVFIAFDPEQVKSATGNRGTFDPQNPDIRFSRDGKPSLIVQHNITAENVLHVDRVGGLAVPSLAVTNVDAPLENFGEITLLGDVLTATPSRDTKVFGADIYSPRYPKVTHKLTEPQWTRLAEKLQPYTTEADGVARWSLDSNDLTESLVSYKPFQRYAAAKTGTDEATMSYSALRSEATELAMELGAQERLFQGYTYSGNRRYVEHTLDRVVKILKKELRGGENFNYGAGSLRAKFTPQFRSIAAIRKAKDKLVTAAEFDAIKDEINNELLDLAQEMVPDGGFRSTDTAMAILEDAAKMGLQRAAKEYDIELSDATRQRAAEFIDKLRNLPTAYFEAKVLRAMDLGEFKAAVIPSDTSPKVRAILERKGVKLYEYDKGKEGDRAAVVRQAAEETPDALFQRGGKAAETGLTLNQFTEAMAEAFGPKVAQRLQAKGVVVPLADQTELPDHVVPFLREGDIVYGFYDPKTNKTYAVLSNLTPEMVKGLALHEVGVHYGFEAMLGKDKYDAVMKRLDVMNRNGIASVVEARNSARRNAVNDSQVGEETLAYLVQNKPELSFIREVIAQIKAFLFREFGIGESMLSTDDLLVLARAAVKHASRAEEGSSAPEFTPMAASRRNVLQALSEADDLFALPKSDKDTIAGIAADTDPSIKVAKIIDGLSTIYRLTMPDGATAKIVVRKPNPYGPSVYGFVDAPDGGLEAMETQRPGTNPEDVPDGTEDVYTDVSLLKEGGAGSLIYNIAATYAHNTGRIFIGDPAGLSDVAMRRRTEHMLSSALKFGTTAHLAPHPRQVEGDKAIGVPPMRWTYGDDLGNIDSLIQTSLAALDYAEPNPLTFEPGTGRFLDRAGRELDERAISSLVGQGSGRAARAGRATLQRNAVLRALLREEGGNASDRGGRVLANLLDVARQSGASTRGIFYSRDGVAKTTSEAFKRWFGDSKVVDADGKPLVVYHGSISGDIESFRTDGDGAIYFTGSSNLASAYSYGRFLSTRPGGGTVYPVHLALQNPLVIDADGKRNDNIPVPWAEWKPKVFGNLPKGAVSVRDAVLRAKEMGHDGLIVRNVVDTPHGDGRTKSDVYVAFAPEQAKSAISNAEFDPANADIRFARGQRGQTTAPAAAPAPATPKPSLWFDETGRLQFAPGAALNRWLADGFVGKALSRAMLRTASPAMRKQLRAMKLTVQAAQDKAVEVAKAAQEMHPDERAMVSDVIEQELAAGTVPPAEVLRMASVMNTAMAEQTQELIALDMLTPEAAARWDGKYLPRYYGKSLGKTIETAWEKAVRGLTRKPSTLTGLKGKHLKGRGLYATAFANEVQDWLDLGYEIRDPDLDPAVKTAADVAALVRSRKLKAKDGVQVWRDFTRDERDDMGEIRDAALRFTLGYMETQRDIALGRMFEAMASDPELSSKTETEQHTHRVPDGTLEGSGAKRYGKLSGRYISRDDFAQLDNATGIQGELFKAYKDALAVWKEGKTVANPVAHFNNVVSNMTMAHFAGVSYWDQHKYIGALYDFATSAPKINEAREAGLFLGTISDEELRNMLPEELRKLVVKTESYGRKLGRSAINVMMLGLRTPLNAAYKGEDLFYRYLIWKDATNRGMDAEDAVDYAQKFIFDYSDLPKTARVIRDAAIPFFSYTYKFIPAFVSTALTHPTRLAAPAAVLWGLQAMAYGLLASGDDEDEGVLKAIWMSVTDPARREKALELAKDEAKNLPEWMKGKTALGTPRAIRLKNDADTGLPMFIDVARIIPGGDVFDINANAGGVPFVQWMTPNNPLLTTFGAMFLNRDAFTGRDIVDKDIDTSAEAAKKRGAWMWKQFTPAITAGSYHWERMMQAAATANGGELPAWVPDLLGGDATGVGRDGVAVTPGRAALNTIGIKIRPIDLDRSEDINESQKQRLIREIDARVRSLQRQHRNGAISDRTLDKERDIAAEKKDRLREGKTIDGDEKE